MAKTVNPKVKEFRLLMSSLEFDMTYRTREIRIKKGFSPEDLSFLLGYNKNFVREIEDPTNKKSYDISLLNYLPKILECSIQKFISNHLPGDNHIRIKAKKWIKGNKAYYEINQLADGNTQKSLIKFQFEENLPLLKKKDKNKVLQKMKIGRPKKGEKTIADTIISKKESDIRKLVVNLFEGNFFSEPKTPFYIFNYCRTIIGEEITCEYVERALSMFTGKKKFPKLKRIKNTEYRWTYIKIDN
jgi:transcriptional regulator with XRE-family HTH domain